MMTFSVCLISVYPWQHVAHLETERAGQIAARRLAERFPGSAFSFYPGPDMQRPDCHPSIRDSALSFEVQRLIAAELVIEDAANPDRLPKWLAFLYSDGSVSAYREHDLPVIEKCRRDPDMIEERPIYARSLAPQDVLDCFRTGENAA